ncbi:TcaA NTF2-like domain-containing protein [Halobacillus sp. B29]|uniref:TcaA NTF2-like domain-containing protein n=1 Tax=Halobacillus sp. B29 TaxID=3457432 RepID=UPI003FCE4E40
MNYCTHCGSHVEKDEHFCTSCGKNQHEEGASTKEKQSETQKVHRKPLTRKTKIIATVSVAAIILLIGTHIAISSALDPLKNVQAMDRALTDRNAKAFFNHVEVDKEALLDKDQYLEFIHQSDWESLRMQLTDEFHSEDSQPFDSTVKDYNGNDLFVVKRNTIVPGLYHSYEIEAIPNNVVASATMDKTTVNMGDHTAKVKEAGEVVELGKAYPGEYGIEGSSSNDFGEFSYQETVSVYPNDAKETEVLAQFPEETYRIETNHSDATLFINGKSTKKKLSEYQALGPFPEEEVVLHAEWKDEEGKTLQTESINLDSDMWGSLVFEFEEEEETEKEIPVYETETEDEEVESVDANMWTSVDAEEHVLGFRDSYESALNDRDYDQVAPYLEEGSKAEEDIAEYIGDLKDKGYNYEFTNNEIIEVEEMSDAVFIITTNEEFIFTNHKDEQIHYDRIKNYTVHVNGDGLKISDIDIDETERNDL